MLFDTEWRSRAVCYTAMLHERREKERKRDEMKHRIKELIAERGYTQKEFAEMMGVDRITVNRVFNSDTLRMSTMDKVMDLLHAEPWELFYTREELIDIAFAEAKKSLTNT